MKKFLATLILALAIVVPALTVEAAHIYVPNFYNMAVNKYQKRISFDGMEQLSNNGVRFTRWHYTVVDGKLSTYVSKYLNRIGTKHAFQQVGQNGNNWYFAYSGGQARYINAFAGGFHIHVGVSGNNVIVDMVAGMYPEV